jgi:hypothetical protein
VSGFIYVSRGFGNAFEKKIISRNRMRRPSPHIAKPTEEPTFFSAIALTG